MEAFSIRLCYHFEKFHEIRQGPGKFSNRGQLAKLVLWGFPMCSPTLILFPQPSNSCNIFRCERPTAVLASNLPIVRCAPLYAQLHTVYSDMHIWLSAIVSTIRTIRGIICVNNNRSKEQYANRAMVYRRSVSRAKWSILTIKRSKQQ